MSRLTEKITQRVVGEFDRNTVSSVMRAKRWALFARTFPDFQELRILDLGGDARAWRTSGLRPRSVLLVNIAPQGDLPEPWLSELRGDVCDPALQTPEVDLVYSNSTIEHVGGHYRRGQFAARVRAAAQRYWIQTPNRRFPVEPHFLFPGLQWLPPEVQARVVARWPFGNYATVTDTTVALRSALAIEMLSAVQFATYFPEAELLRERVAGLTKSLIAVKR